MSLKGQTPWRKRRQASQGFTILEALVALSILSFVLAGVITTQLFGLKLFETGRLHRVSNSESRDVFALLSEEITSARFVFVGTGGAASFTPAAHNQSQIGNALQLHINTDTNEFIRYFSDSTDGSLKRITSDSAPMRTIVTDVLNTNLFRIENHLGATQTNQIHHPVIGISLELGSYGKGEQTVGVGQQYDRHIWNHRITPRPTH